MDVPQTYAGALRTGTTAILRVPERPSDVFNAMVTHTSASISENSRTMLVQLVLLPNLVLGRKEDTAPFDARPKAPWLWMGTLEFAVDVRSFGAVQRLPNAYRPAVFFAETISLIKHATKQTGERSARKTARYVRSGGGWKRDHGSRIEALRESGGTPTGA